MDVLCLDIGSSGVRGARFNERLEISSVHDSPWNLHRDAEGRATLSVYDIECAVADVAQTLASPAPAAISAGCFMHSFLVMSSCCAALTPVFTWLDTSRPEGVDIVRRRIGNAFHERTGCHYYPMFPVFKLAANPPGRGNRVGSPKTWLAWELTGAFVEDCGMASASGMADVRADVWDPELAQILRIDLEDLPQIVDPDAIVGEVHEAGSARFGVPAGTKLVAGSGDGFLANVGSGCTTLRRIAITLGTSGVARQMVLKPALNSTAGTFCYRARSDAFLLGCASSNGGNVLDWGRNTFGPMATDVQSSVDLPIFLPFVNGERSLEWDADLKESWHGRRDTHTSAQLSRAVVEGVLFNIAQYVEVVERESGVVAEDVVLSGNAFQDPLLAPMLASLLGRDLVQPEYAGLATLRGAAVYAWRALGHDVAPLLEKEVMGSERIKSMLDPSLKDRFMEFKQLRQHVVRSSL